MVYYVSMYHWSTQPQLCDKMSGFDWLIVTGIISYGFEMMYVTYRMCAMRTATFKNFVRTNSLD